LRKACGPTEITPYVAASFSLRHRHCSCFHASSPLWLVSASLTARRASSISVSCILNQLLSCSPNLTCMLLLSAAKCCYHCYDRHCSSVATPTVLIRLRNLQLDGESAWTYAGALMRCLRPTLLAPCYGRASHDI
jgi:hypothetical protein